MKRYYRQRFIVGAMLSFLILIILAVSGVWFFSYRQMERDTDAFLTDRQNVDEEDLATFSQAAPPPMFGYTPDQRRYPSGFYEITMNADGTIQEIGQRGIVEDAGISVQQYVQQAVAEGASRGKIGSYKYDIAFQEDGTAHIILLDISIQLQILYNMLKSALMVGGILSIALFLILIPVSGRVAGAFMRNAERQKQFITDAGHDLKTPIAIMRSNLDVMELLQGKSQWTENLRSQITRLERLVAQLMMMARLEEMRESGAAEEIALSAMLREQWQGYAAQTALKQIDAKAEIEDGMRVRSRGETLRQMINLLMDNAVQYTDDHGSIRLSVKREKKKICLCLCNSVDHLPSQPPEALTGRFVRGDGARNQKNGGAGIGLAAVKRIVDIHGGKLEIRYQGDHLFCVQVDLPAA